MNRYVYEVTFLLAGFLLIVFLGVSSYAYAADAVHHQIKLKLVPESSQLIVEDQLSRSTKNFYPF